jgi:hypothetical protein
MRAALIYMESLYRKSLKKLPYVICYLPSDVVPQRNEDEDLDSESYLVDNYFRAVNTSQVNWARTFAEFETAPEAVVLGALRHLKYIYSKNMQIPLGMKTKIPIGVDMGFCIEPEPPTPEAGLADTAAELPDPRTAVSSTSVQAPGVVDPPPASGNPTTRTPLPSSKDSRVRKARDLDYEAPHFKPSKRKSSKPIGSNARKRVRIAADLISDADDEGLQTDAEPSDDIGFRTSSHTKTTKSSMRTKPSTRAVLSTSHPVIPADSAPLSGKSSRHNLFARVFSFIITRSIHFARGHQDLCG